MAPKGNFLGGIFDFNRDGSTSFTEKAIGYDIATNIPGGGSYSDCIGVGDNDGILNIDTEDWRYEAEDNPVGDVDPWDYDCEEDYLEAVSDYQSAVQNKYLFSGENNIFSETDEEDDEVYNEPTPIEYRRQNAEKILKQGRKEYSQDTIDRCEFIVNSSCIASKYLDSYGEFDYIEAVKDNFELSPDVFKTDAISYFYEIIEEMAEHDPAYALQIWKWAVKEFAPHAHFLDDDNEHIFGFVYCKINDYPPEFVRLVIEEMEKDEEFCKLSLSSPKGLSDSVPSYIAHAFDTGHIKAGKNLFIYSLANPNKTSKEVEEYIYDVLGKCDLINSAEALDIFKAEIIPYLKEFDNNRIQRILPDIIEEIDSKISHLENYSDRYRFSRKFAWRAKYINDNSGYDPLSYLTEEAYLERKYSWRSRLAVYHNKYGINPVEYETEKEYMDAVNTHRLNISRTELDAAVYTFIGVKFAKGGQIYYYLYDGNDVDVGDKIVIPVGEDCRDKIVEAVTVQRHRNATAPCPLSRINKVKRKYTKEA